jgi:two-component system, chemotaxis family, chemotaxis protein CheY
LTLDLTKLKILVVEDHPAHAETIRAMLEGFGISRIDMAADVEAAVRFLKAGTLYDLMLCDYNLGTINGLSLVKVVRADNNLTNRYMPIIMLTGDTRTDRNILARDAGVNDFLSKPAHPPVLLRTIQTVLERPRAYVDTKDGYFGPDRRRRQDENLVGRRSSDRSEPDLTDV